MTAAAKQEPESIFVLMPRVLADITAVAKDGTNTQQNYKFRSVEAIYASVRTALAKHGVFYMPTVLEREKEERQTKAGGVMAYVTVKVRYRFYGPTGDYVDAEEYGEGSDTGDKASSKAQTSAVKYALIHAFAIPLEGDHDADTASPEFVAAPAPPGWKSLGQHDEARKELATRMRALPPEERDVLKTWWEQEGWSWPLSVEAFGEFEQKVSVLETAVAEEQAERTHARAEQVAQENGLPLETNA